MGGWDGISNGKLLTLAAASFDVVLTVDRNPKYQQNLKKPPVAVIVLATPDGMLSSFEQLVPELLETLTQLKPRPLIELQLYVSGEGESSVSVDKKLFLNDEELESFEATRDLGAELLQAGKEVRAGLGHVVYSPLIAARKNTGLSQEQFAALLGISANALETLEQKREQPDGAVRTLISVALTHPEALVAVAEQTAKGNPA